MKSIKYNSLNFTITKIKYKYIIVNTFYAAFSTFSSYDFWQHLGPVQEAVRCILLKIISKF